MKVASLWLPPVAFMVGVFLLVAPKTTELDLTHWDKLVHVIAYGVFGAVNLRAFHGGFRRLRPGPTVAALLLTIGYGAFDEWNQTRFPGRDPSVEDWLADLAGAFLAVPLFALAARRWSPMA